MTRAIQPANMRQYQCAFGLLAVLIFGLVPIARAEVHVNGSPASVRVTTSEEDTISEVLSAFAAAFNVRYRTAISLDATTGNAIYLGSFGQVVSRLLQDYNYVIKRNQEAIEIIIVERRAAVSATEMPAAAAQIHATEALAAAATERRAGPARPARDRLRPQ
jgi:hypothetical protein